MAAFDQAAERFGCVFDHGDAVASGQFPALLESLNAEAAGHWQRLIVSAARLGIRLPSESQCLAALDELLGAAGLADARLRLTVTAGSASGLLPDPGAVPRVILTVMPLPPPRGSARLITSRYRHCAQSPLSGIKTTSYAGNIVLLREAAAAGADEVLVFNSREELCEAAMANVFIVRNGRIFTPPLSSGCLPGVMRAVILRSSAGAVERVLTAEDCTAADEIFLTSSIRGADGVVMLDGRSLPAAGPVTQAVQRLLAQADATN